MEWPLIQAFTSKASMLREGCVRRIRNLLGGEKGGFTADGYINSGLDSCFERCFAEMLTEGPLISYIMVDRGIPGPLSPPALLDTGICGLY